MSNTLCCDICNVTSFETPIIEKPLQLCRKAKIYKLSQVNKDNRKQDNTCLDCLRNEANAINKKEMKSSLPTMISDTECIQCK